MGKRSPNRFWNNAQGAIVLGLPSLLLDAGASSAIAQVSAPWAHWRFEEGAVGAPASGFFSVLDSSGNSRHGTPFGGPQYVTSPFQAGGRALYFDGTDDSVIIPDSSEFPTAMGFTIEAYVRLDQYNTDATGQNQIVFRGDDRSAQDTFSLGILSNRQLFFAVDSTAGVRYQAAGWSPWNLGGMMHIAGVYDPITSSVSVYCNGVLVASSPFVGVPISFLTGTNPGLGIGNLQSPFAAQRLRGVIDEVRVSPGALRPDEFLPGVVTPSSSDLWDVSSNVVVTNRSPMQPGYSGYEMFGLQNTSVVEMGTTAWPDGSAIGTVHWTEWQTPEPVTIGSIRLFAGEDLGPTELRRVFDHVTIRAKSASSSSFDMVVLDTNVQLPYARHVGSFLVLSPMLACPATARHFRAEFRQATQSLYPGPRVIELDAFPPSDPALIPIVSRSWVRRVAGQPVVLQAVYGGAASQVRWRRNGVLMANGGRVTGASSFSLSISSVEPSDAGTYQCTVTTPCGTQVAAPAITVVVACSVADVATDGFPVNRGPDGFITGTDFDVFLQAFFAELRFPDGELIADVANDSGVSVSDGFLTGMDFELFVARFFEGC